MRGKRKILLSLREVQGVTTVNCDNCSKFSEGGGVEKNCDLAGWSTGCGFCAAGIREFLCKLCNYKGVTQSDLNRHMKSQIHMMKMQNECRLCGEG